jgi:D-alanyl-D-alanine carboxypeptidase (penicillin-binding protein 5/6)
VLLTLPAVIIPTGASAGQPGTRPVARTPYRACPAPTPPVPRPSRPAAPTPDSRQRQVGGPELDTAGLVIPADAPTPPEVTATSWLVADLDTGTVLGACGPHEYAVPASTQKLLLAAAVLPRLDPAQVVEVTESDLDFEPGSSAVGLVRGGRYTVETLWLGLLLNSGNDAANVLARLGGGPAGQAGGVAAMNAEARALGALQTHAATPSGLDGPGQYTSAYDLALIARACFAREDFRRYAATRVAHVPAQPGAKGFPIWNDNQLLHRYPGALGGKTGYTDLARHSFVGAARRDGRTLLVTLLGAESQPLAGWQQGAALLDWGFALPAGAGVGQLVARGQLDAASRGPSHAAGAGAAEPVNNPPSPGLWLLFLVGGAAIVAVPLVVLWIRQRMRSRASATTPDPER